MIAEQMATEVVTPAELRLLKHMLGAEENFPPRDWGFRNHFAASGKDEDSKLITLMESKGLVIKGGIQFGMQFFHATHDGVVAAGLKGAQMERALRRENVKEG